MIVSMGQQTQGGGGACVVIDCQESFASSRGAYCCRQQRCWRADYALRWCAFICVPSGHGHAATGLVCAALARMDQPGLGHGYSRQP